jgi:hypothetical protein
MKSVCSVSWCLAMCTWGALCTGGLVTMAAHGPAVQSPAVARELARLMGEQKLDAAAARDPEQPHRFIAVLYYPGAQFLVVSAAYPVPEHLEQRLVQRQFRDAYLDLQGAGAREGKFFVTDLQADGLHPTRENGEPFDIIYVDGVQQIAYDGNWSDQKLTESEYNARFQADDARYARLLTALIQALKAPPTTPDADAMSPGTR